MTTKQSSGIRKALGQPESVQFQGQTWPLEPLTFLDLADAEALGLITNGGADGMTPTSILWLMLRKADPSLTDTQRDLCQYTMTPREARALFTLAGDGQESADFMSRVISAAGLTAESDELADDGEDPKTEAPTKGESSAKKGRGAREYKAATPETPATPIAE